MTPQASSISIVIEHGRLYFLAISWNPRTSSSSFPSPKRNLGVSFSRMTVILATLMKKTRAPAVNIRYLHPLLLLYGHSPIRFPSASNGFGQFHFAWAAVCKSSVMEKNPFHSLKNPQARNPVIACPKPHQEASHATKQSVWSLIISY
jgi:hypothetical protein